MHRRRLPTPLIAPAVGVALGMALAVAACSPSPTLGPSPRDVPGSSPAPAATTTPEPEQTAAPTPLPVADAPPTIELALITGGLDAPIGMAVAGDGSGRLFVHEQGGRVRVVTANGSLTDAPFVDLGDRVEAGGERGLLGLAFHPDFSDNRRLFVHYSRRADGATVLSELTANQDLTAADPASERVLLTHEQPYGNHNGGQLAFGPDGMLHLGLGDGGSGADPHGHGQNPDTLLGTLLRLDVDGVGDAPYAVPDDNPFVGGGGAPEVWAYGLRNPWRFSFDRVSGELWVADVGQNAWEEVNRLPPGEGGLNLGWNWLEASHCFRDGCDPTAFIGPVSEYSHEFGCSVTGGYVARDETSPAMWGWYLFGDYCSGILFGIRSDVASADGEVVAPERLLDSGRSISAFGQGEDGALYLVDISSGELYRVVAR